MPLIWEGGGAHLEEEEGNASGGDLPGGEGEEYAPLMEERLWRCREVLLNCCLPLLM